MKRNEEIEMLNAMWKRIKGEFCFECNGPCDKCPVEKAMDAIAELTDTVMYEEG